MRKIQNSWQEAANALKGVNNVMCVCGLLTKEIEQNGKTTVKIRSMTKNPYNLLDIGLKAKKETATDSSPSSLPFQLGPSRSQLPWHGSS